MRLGVLSLREVFIQAQCGCRTSKSSVEHELAIPKQTRFLVPVELGRVEKHASIFACLDTSRSFHIQVYDQSLEEALLELGFDARGVAAVEGWQVDSSLLRTWLRKLRGFCTHPQVGQLQNQRDKLNAYGVLKTIGEVLDVHELFNFPIPRA
jgi:E3 ubiquitin-protein ligase SHPRH